ncbi:carboxymuconolactone decarboxylase family protein [Piscinibacter sp.]|uniref:carboxymuconolactone decarboxylase family protein n=1 Tax=Piscinibacter sp. TaxID=1903157 RepID=UPI0039E68E64
MSLDRLPALPRESWTPLQAECADEVISGPRRALISPFVPLLRSPELMRHAQRMGEYLRYRSALGLHLSEFVILLVARAWSQPVEWAIHAPIAQRAGVSPATIAAIAEGRRPADLSAHEALVYDFCKELESHRTVADTTWTQAVSAFGEAGTVDLLGLVGYYGLLAVVMNAARTAVPADGAPTLPALP